MSKIRPRVTEEEYNVIVELRKRHEALSKECEEKGLPIENVNHYWYKGENFSINVKSPSPGYKEVRDAIIEEMKSYAPVYKQIKRDKVKEPHLLVVDPSDIHIGKLSTKEETGDEYNVEIAVKRVLDGVEGLMKKCNGFSFDKVMYIIGNDILHTDSPKRLTTSGTPQDTDGMWYNNFITAKNLHIKVIEMLLTVADVYVQYDPSNHDYTSGFFLADTISSWFANNKHVKFNTSISHRKYFRYGNNLIGSTHGDGAKEADLPLLMAHETGIDWAECKHKYIYTHHIHHKKSKDYMGVTVESMRSPSGPDSWHHRNGYLHSPKGIDAFIHHPTQGQIARISHIF